MMGLCSWGYWRYQARLVAAFADEYRLEMGQPYRPPTWPLRAVLWATRALQSLRSSRICAICLEDIPRASYDIHMRDGHGYEALSTRPRGSA